MKIGHWFVVVVVVHVNSALMNLFLKKWCCTYGCIWIPYRLYLQIHQTSYMYTGCFNYLWIWWKLGICQQCPLPSYKIITFYSLYNYKTISYHWHIKPISPCYSSIMDIWHHGGGGGGGRQFCIIPGDEALFWISKGNLRNSKGFIQCMQDCTVMPTVNTFSCFIGFIMG